MLRIIVFTLLFFSYAFAKANTTTTLQDTTNIARKVYRATRISTPPKIDGKPFDKIWDRVTTGGNFIMAQPNNGDAERDTHRTEFKVAYDDAAIYVAGYMYDENPESVLRQFSQRDQVFEQADLFGFFINTYNNQINQTRFYATSANALGDAIAEGNSQDFSYNVVFLSEVSFDERGWYVEMKIPYRTLRFPEQDVQDWSFQILRVIKSLNEEYTYNYIDVTTGTDTQYDALLTGIENIDPPLRLNLYPYVSVIHDRFDDIESTSFNAGMDLKYGISDAFTLDATLIPDFGQVAFDQVVLNLGPFEQTFNENRAFFTEGTDLFRKGDLFFSRRIGQRPSGSRNLEVLDDEDIINNPRNAQLLNAIKVTGRTEKGLGIGILNAITEKTNATIQNRVDGTRREVETEPLTNYNMLVLDQQYGNNSSIALVNASTLRNGSFTDANSNAIVLNHNNKAATDNISAEVKMTNRFTPDGTETGFATEANWRKTSGKWRPRLGHFFRDRNYNPNDLGRNFQTNFHTFAADLDYVQLTQKGIFNRYEISLRTRHRRAASPGFHTGSEINLNPFFITKERFAFGADFNYYTDRKDQFESRIEDLVVKYGQGIFTGGFISSDYRKKFAIDIRAGRFKRLNEKEHNYDFRIAPRYRFSDQFLLIYSLNWDKNNDRMSYVTLTDDDTTSILSERDTHSVENRLTGTYNFNNRQALSISFRNFWSRATFSRDFKELLSDGSLENSDYELEEDFNPDANFNVWNLDLSYRWRFAPGSEASLLYRNSISNFDNQGAIQFEESLDNLFMEPVRHNLSLRITYFLDVNAARKWFKA
ncbi:DUF5916 domain-containing protein [Nonlabens ulvanivorans]|uniref:DUF5916 domain-containing protein n=1 Tax=Nonlabens ulvanivorans TaxID=906888 RepID=UPI002942732D|nr:DUF5916 domain-containing protein [Nonlabens ulvanivorans]WOI23570.1 DUF5916 domain-containing protein [Nonlabens ulvanivorans]